MDEQRAAPGNSWLVIVLASVGMLAAGMAIPAQGRVNAELTQEVGNPYLAALISFFVGLVVMCGASFGTAAGRRAMSRVLPALREGAVQWWHFLAGVAGGYFVLSQTLTIGLLGVAIFTVAVVTGQTLGGLLWDRIGLGPAGRKQLSLMRVFGALLTVVAVVWVVTPQMGSSGFSDANPWLFVALVLLPFTAGFLQAGQQALNGRQAAAYVSPLPGTLINFAAGTLSLFLAWIIAGVLSGTFTEGAGAVELSGIWWHYLGGPFGIVFIALGAVLVAQVGVLVTAMGMIAGQLLGSLFLDWVFPTAGSVITAATIWGTILTLVAVVVASLPDITRRGR